jgi:hypothetical protein
MFNKRKLVMLGKNSEWSKPVPILEGDEKNPPNYFKENGPNINLISDRTVFVVGRKLSCRCPHFIHDVVSCKDSILNLPLR